MKWTLIRSWAKEQGYKITREKSGDDDNPYIYTWSLIDDPEVGGVTNSLSKVATTIYNHMTNNAHLAYQQKYMALKTNEEIRYDATL
jgi:hypothetical protein